jgi:hypothetical protein
MKAYIHRIYRKEYGKYSDYREYIKLVVRKVSTSATVARRARGYFRNTGIYGVLGN